MHIQYVAYSLEGISEEEYLDVAHRLAPRTAGLPGLLAKVWLENPGANRYGAIYFWEDLESMERFTNSDMYEGRVPEFADLISEEFSVLENLTGITQPLLEIVEARRPPTGAPTPAPSLAGVQQPAPTTKKRTPPPGRAPAAKAPAKKAGAATAPPKTAGAVKAFAKKTSAAKSAAKAVAGKAGPVKVPVKVKKAGKKSAR